MHLFKSAITAHTIGFLLAISQITAGSFSKKHPAIDHRSLLAKRDCPVTLTPAAQDKLKGLIEQDGGGLMCRIFVKPGGCSNLRFELSFVDVSSEGDEKCVEPNGVTVLIDPLSRPYVIGANIDIKDEVCENNFKITVPSCSGAIFDVEEN